MPIGPNGERRPSNPVAAGVLIAKLATGEAKEEHVDLERQARGKKGGEARAAALTAPERKLIARQAAAARWDRAPA